MMKASQEKKKSKRKDFYKIHEFTFEVYQSIIWVVKIHFEICAAEDFTAVAPTSK